MRRDEVLAVVAEHVSYLRATGTADGDDWVSCEAFASDPATLTSVVRGTMAGFGTDDEAVAASLFAQAYAFRVAGVALAAYALDLPVPDVAASATSVRIDKPRPSAVAYLSSAVCRRSAAGIVDELVAQHFGDFIAAVHGAFRVGERLLWGDVAASCAVAFRAIESSGADAGEVRSRAEAFFAAAAFSFDGLGSFTSVRHGAREGWYWDRTSCCLWFRTTSGQLCDNCSLIEAAELRERRVAELAGAES